LPRARGEEYVQGQGADARVGVAGGYERHARGDQVAVPGEPRIALGERGEPAPMVVGGRADLDGQRRVRLVEHEVDFLLAVTPVKKPDAAMQRERVQRGGDQVLQEQPEFDRVVERRQASLERGIAHRRIDEVQLPAALLHAGLSAGVVGQREDQERPFQIGQVSVEGRLREPVELAANSAWREHAGDLAGENVQQPFEHHRIADPKGLRNVLVDRAFDRVAPQDLLGDEQSTLFVGRPVRIDGEQLRKAADEQESPPSRLDIDVPGEPRGKPADRLGQVRAYPQVDVVADQVEELTEQIGREVVLGPAANAALWPAAP
jgi:hypothetical protein